MMQLVNARHLSSSGAEEHFHWIAQLAQHSAELSVRTDKILLLGARVHHQVRQKVKTIRSRLSASNQQELPRQSAVFLSL